ncbi:helix-turn-helix domain-containing protein [Shewanella acanthi]|uniref:helix-turn-helix domain-containing protein n=1 Tax=Shewanella acanthi TaxID=2864212 RepID=UPI001C65F2CE|nr:helix-turn-helix domain-containing protein [Shewanella acanthi]QYJ79410.1 helix-turn-helix domain-containing protein [Shewanella acanthi]
MSMELMVKAMKAKVGNPLRKLVLIKLADNANDSGECWPSYQYIADQCEIGKSTVRKHITDLAKAGFLSIESRKGPKGNLTNVYTLTLCHQIAHPVSPDSIGMPPDSTPPMPPDSTGISHSLETVNEPLKDLPAKAGQATPSPSPTSLSKTIELDYSSWPAMPSQPIFKDWLEVRKSKRAKLTQSAINRLAPQLHQAVAAGLSVDEVFELCAAKCWIGFEFIWLVNAGLVKKAPADWSSAVFNEGDPLL